MNETQNPGNPDFSPVFWLDGSLRLLDQTLLPDEEVWLICREPEQVAEAIRRLAVRGAPAIGVAAAYGMVLGLQTAGGSAPDGRMREVADMLGSTRPTAVNLRWAIELSFEAYEAIPPGRDKVQGLLEWAEDLRREDIATNRRIGQHAIPLFFEGDRVLTHCNAGALATAGYGTAVGVIQAAWEHGRVEKVWVDETRPLLQGARLTSWELARLGIPHHLVIDSAVGILMSRGKVDRVVVGADRIAANGDVANKVGTYVVATLAARHGVPFYVAAPLSTVDPRTPDGSAIPIEERASEEVTSFTGHRVAPEGTEAINFAFDVTPSELIRCMPQLELRQR